MYRGYTIAVVMPVYNEAECLRQALVSMPNFVDQIILVDDASTDSLSVTLQTLSKSTPLKVLRHNTNLGVGAATITGYRYALKNAIDLVALMDGDGQMDGQDLSIMLDTLIDGSFDFVKGNRFAHPSIKEMPWTRYIGNRLLSWLTRKALGYPYQLDSQCGYTVFKSSGLIQLDLEALFPRYGFPNDLLFQIVNKGLSFTTVPTKTIYGKEISGINPTIVIPTILWIIVRGYFKRLLTYRKIHISQIEN